MKKKKSTDEQVEKSKSMFDILNGIYQDQSVDFFNSLTEAELKTYRSSKYIMNRFISMTPEYIPIVDAIQTYSTIPEKYHYLFFSNILPKKKVYSKYIKSSVNLKYNQDLIKLIAKHYSVSTTHAIEYIDILMQQDKQELINICKSYGIDLSIIDGWMN